MALPLHSRLGAAALALALAAGQALPQSAPQRPPGKAPSAERTAVGLPIVTSDGKAIGKVVATGVDDDNQPVLVGEIERLPNPKGDRVKITMSGKFLPYKYYGNEQGILDYGVKEA